MRNYNTRIESVPSNVIANTFKFEKATYFEINDPEVRRAPTVSFGEIGSRGEEQPRGETGTGQLEGRADGLPNPQAYDSRTYSQPPQASDFDQPQQPNYRPNEQGQGGA